MGESTFANLSATSGRTEHSLLCKSADEDEQNYGKRRKGVYVCFHQHLPWSYFPITTSARVGVGFSSLSRVSESDSLIAISSSELFLTSFVEGSEPFNILMLSLCLPVSLLFLIVKLYWRTVKPNAKSDGKQ